MSKKTTTIKSLAIALAMMCSGTAFAQTTITDEAGLQAIADGLSGSYVLGNDITLSGEWTPIGTEDEPFTGTLDGAGYTIYDLTITTGDENVGFFSYTEGATVKNISFVNATVYGSYQAGIVAGQAITSEISQVFTSGLVTGYDHIGGIVGDARGDATNDDITYITDCLSTAGAISAYYQAGGIAGWTNAGYFTNNITVGSAAAPSGGAGGIVGLLDNSGLASFVGNVSAAGFLTGGTYQTHGIVGWKNGSSCSYGDDEANYSSEETVYTCGGTVTAAADVEYSENNEGIMGEIVSVSDLQSSSVYTTAGFSTSVWNLSTGTYPVLSRLSLPLDADYIYVADQPDLCALGATYDTEAYSTMGRTVTITSSNTSVVSVDGTTLSFDASGTATVTISTTGDSYANGVTKTLTIEVQSLNYNISTPEELINMKYDLAGDFTLANDIDMDGYDWDPIGTFTGTFDGQGHTIKNLYFDEESTSAIGLFSITNDATIKNVAVEGAYFVGYANVAGIVGRAYGGTVESCAVINSYIEGRDHVASIAGDINVNDDNEGATIRNCISDSEIYSRYYQAGGIGGVIVAGLVENCLFSGIVEAAGSSNATAIVSLIDADDYLSTIQNNAALASHIYSGSTAQRIVVTAGRSCELYNNYGLETCYVGNSSSNAGGLSNQTDATSVQGANVSDDDARTQDFYESTLGWDFDGTWKFFDGAEGKMYPVLDWMTTPLTSVIYDMPQNKSLLYETGFEFVRVECIHGSWGQTLDMEIIEGSEYACFYDGDLYAGDEDGNFSGRGDVVVQVTPTEDVADNFNMTGDNTFTVYIGLSGDQTEISTTDEFIAINKNLGGDYILTADLDFNNVDFDGIAASGEAFTGTFDGNGHVIKNIYVKYSSGDDVGIFGETNGATIKNVAFEKFTVAASSSNHVGLVGTATTTKFEQVAAVGTVTGDDHVAILAGDGDGCTVTNCYVDGNLTAGSQIGGFFGCTLDNGANVTYSYFNGSLTATYRGWVGGIIGLIDVSESEVTVTNCVSIGDCDFTSSASGSPQNTAPFICGNGATTDDPYATITFYDNYYNSSATMGGDTDWPSNNETVDGGTVEAATATSASNLQGTTIYTNIGWDFDEVWTFDTSNGYLYPVLQQFGDISTGIKSIRTVGTNDAYGVYARDNVLTVVGLDGSSVVNVVSASGQAVASTATSAESATMSLPGKGLYIVTVTSNGSSRSIKVVNK